MRLRSRLERLERSANFAPLPCPMCALVTRHVADAAALLGEAPFWSPGVAFSYNYVCHFCGLAETRPGNAPDAEAAQLFAEALNALAAGRFCDVADSDLLEFDKIYNQAARDRLGADFPRWQALCKDFSRAVGEMHATYKPRVPYVCRIEGCGCERQKAAA